MDILEGRVWDFLTPAWLPLTAVPTVSGDLSDVERTSFWRSSCGSGFAVGCFWICSPPKGEAMKLSGRLSRRASWAESSSLSPYKVPIASVTWWVGSDMDSWLPWPRRCAKLLPASRGREDVCVQVS